MRLLLNLWAVGSIIGVTAATAITEKTLETVRDSADDALVFVYAFNASYSARIRGRR